MKKEVPRRFQWVNKFVGVKLEVSMKWNVVEIGTDSPEPHFATMTALIWANVDANY